MNDIPPDAMFRYAVISQVHARIARGQSRAEAVAETAAFSHPDANATTRRVSVRSLYRWLGRYARAGIAGLADPPRTAVEHLDPVLVEFLLDEVKLDPQVSVPELIRRAHDAGVLRLDAAIDRSTIYRALVRRGVSLRRTRKLRGRDTRRFAYPHRMDLVLCDGKHFRAGRARTKRVALSFLDDASRHVLHVVVGPSESAELFLRGLHACVLKYGLMTALYLDRGPGFIADATRIVAAKLGVHLVLGEAAYPQGHGKIERYHRTLTADLLRHLDGRLDVDPDMRALELRLRHYAEQVYAMRPHHGIDGQTPHARFFADPKPLRLPHNEASVDLAFIIHHARRVGHDHVIQLAGASYEMPRGTAGKRVTLQQRVLDGSVWLLHESRLIQLHPVDTAANARDPRAQGPKPDADPPSTAGTTSSADTRFDTDFPPVVGEDGGYPVNDNDDDNDDDHDDSDPFHSPCPR